MNISGLQKTSAIDYTDNLTAIVFTQGCNFRCPYCHNPSLLSLKEGAIEEKYIFNFLDKRKGLLDAVTITGGEPTLQPDLMDFCKKVKAKGYKVKLDTNGTNPDIIKKLIYNKFIDYIAMDLKDDLNSHNWLLEDSSSSKNIIDNIKQTIDIIKSSNIDYEFRTTVIPEVHTKDKIRNIAKTIKGADKYYIQNFKNNSVYSKEFQRKRSFSEQELEEFKRVAGNFANSFIRNY